MSLLAVIDPNWSSDSGGGGRGANEHYALSGIDSIAAEYKRSEPWTDVGPGILWMWATTLAFNTGDAHALARALGFKVCSGFVWAKVDEHTLEGAFYFKAPARMGLGQWQRTEHEHLLLCRRGVVSVPPPEARPRSIIYAPRGAHSEKPEAAWHVIEAVSRAALPGVIGIEYNARKRRRGWAAVGRLDGEDGSIRFEAA